MTLLLNAALALKAAVLWNPVAWCCAVYVIWALVRGAFDRRKS
jgi:threonine/homoserine/homoserine lactone efflux protein